MSQRQFPAKTIQSTFGLGWQETPTTQRNSSYGIPFNDNDVDAIMAALTYSSYPYGGNFYNNFRDYYIGKFITDLKTDLGITKLTDMFDCMYMFATATQSDAYVNWAQPGKYDITPIGTFGSALTNMTFTPNIGFHNNDISSVCALNTNFNPFLQESNYGGYNKLDTSTTGQALRTQGSFGVFLTPRNEFALNSYVDLGAVLSLNSSGRGSGTIFSSRAQDGVGLANQLTANILTTGSNSPGGISAPFTLYPGLFSVVRSTVKETEIYWNGLSIAAVDSDLTNGLVQPIAVDRGTITLLAPNIGATGTNISIGSNLASRRQQSFFYIGSSRIKPEIINFRLQQFFYAIGFNPVTGTDANFAGNNVSGYW